jgi:hypothetical protein
MDFYIKSSKTSPSVHVNTSEGFNFIKGKSVPESSVHFYFPIIDKLKVLIKKDQHITLEFDLEYFNTSSSKCIFDLIRAVKRRTKNLQVNWYYEEFDTDMMETGEDFSDALMVPFNFLASVPEEYRTSS